jgi:methionine synthase II (cobalamin-independent)
VPVPLLLVGSLPVPSAEAAVRDAAAFQNALPAIPDGETGPAREGWIQASLPAMLMAKNVDWRQPGPGGDLVQAVVRPRGLVAHTRADTFPGKAYRTDPGTPIDIPRLGYATWAAESAATLQELESQGVLAPGTRLQVCYPSPFPAGYFYASPDDVEAFVQAYARALAVEFGELQELVPHDRLAVQIDEVSPLFWPAWDDAAKEHWADVLAEVASGVAEDVPLGLHLCYGDLGGKHDREPDDLGDVVEMVKTWNSPRALDWVHVPVPLDRTDDAYLEPLQGLDVETTLYLGCLHPSEDAGAARTRLSRARAFLPAEVQLGASTECGMGRFGPDQYRSLLTTFGELATGD